MAHDLYGNEQGQMYNQTAYGSHEIFARMGVSSRLQVELHDYPSPLLGSLVLFDVTKLEHPIPVALRSRDRLLELLQHLRVRREVLAPLSVDRSETFADQVHVD
jgi:hypothetical protein